MTGPAVAGLRRVHWVRIILSRGRDARAEVVGMGHRLPAVRPVSLATATSLAANGVPTVVLKTSSSDASHGRLPLSSRH